MQGKKSRVSFGWKASAVEDEDDVGGGTQTTEVTTSRGGGRGDVVFTMISVITFWPLKGCVDVAFSRSEARVSADRGGVGTGRLFVNGEVLLSLLDVFNDELPKPTRRLPDTFGMSV